MKHPPRREVTAAELAQPLMPYTDAVARVLEAVAPLPPAELPLRECLALVSAEAVVAVRDLPAFDNSSMDGYAVRAAETGDASPERPVRLRVEEGSAAGVPGGPLEAGGAATIMTGAQMPPGADAVVPWELTERRDDDVVLRAPARTGQNVRPRGEDARTGDVLVPAGTVLRPLHLGVIAAAGHARARVHPRPRVAVLSSGAELVPPGEPAGEGQIHDSNTALLLAESERAGARVVAAELVGDDPGAIEAALRRLAAGADLVVTSGGASVGEHDWLRDVLARLGRIELWRVAIKPGKPLALATVDGVPVIGLPGNPGSVFACTHVFVAPAIRRMAGRDPSPRWFTATLTEAVRGDRERTFFCPAVLEGDRVRPVPAPSSGALASLAAADAFAVVPPGGLEAGAAVRVEPLADGVG